MHARRKPWLVILACVTVAVQAGAARDRQPAAAPVAITVIRAARLVDVEAGTVLRNHQVLVEGKMIKSVGPVASPPAGIAARISSWTSTTTTTSSRSTRACGTRRRS